MTLSREGWIFSFFGVLALIAFSRSFIALSLYTGVVFLCIPIFSIIWCILAMRGIEIRREIPEEGVATERLFATYRIAGNSLFPAFGVRFTDNATRGFIETLDITQSSGVSYKPSSTPLARFLERLDLIVIDESDLFEEAFHSVGIEADFPVQFPPLMRGEWYEKTIPVKFPVRGKYRVGPGKITAGDPLGIFRMTVNLSGFNEILILPTWTPLTRFPQGGSSRILRDENIPMEREGSSPEFLAVREYRPGDPQKTVHWKLTAKHDQLMVKQFVQQVESSWGLILDLRKGTNAGQGGETSLEYMVSIAVSLLKNLDEEKVPHVLILAGDDLIIRESMRGERRFPDELRLLAACRNDGSLPLYERSARLATQYPQLSWIVITSRKDQDIINSIEALTYYRGRVLLTQIDLNSFLTEEFSEEMIVKWRRMWGEEIEGFENSIISLGALYYSVRRGDDLSMIYFQPTL